MRDDEFTRVQPTEAEVRAYRKRAYGSPDARFSPAVYRVVCNRCGKRIWKSGIGVGSHRRSCPGRNR